MTEKQATEKSRSSKGLVARATNETVYFYMCGCQVGHVIGPNTEGVAEVMFTTHIDYCSIDAESLDLLTFEKVEIDDRGKVCSINGGNIELVKQARRIEALAKAADLFEKHVLVTMIEGEPTEAFELFFQVTLEEALKHVDEEELTRVALSFNDDISDVAIKML